MLRTAICDDSKVFCEGFVKMLEKEDKVESIAVFEEPAALLQAAEQGQTFDVVFMDIDFQHRQEGMSAASRLFEISPASQIIYITAYNDLYSQQVLLHEANLTGYITKPVQEDILHKYLDKASETKDQQRQFLTISIKGKQQALLLNQITLLESNRHQVRIQTLTGQYIIYDKLSNLIPKLSSDFIQCHKSFVINANYIEHFSTEKIVVKNEDFPVPVSRAFKKPARDAFFRYANERVRS